MKKAIIVEASSGIGKALASILVDDNYIIGVTGRRETELLKLQAANSAYIKVSSFDCTTENNGKKRQVYQDSKSFDTFKLQIQPQFQSQTVTLPTKRCQRHGRFPRPCNLNY